MPEAQRTCGCGCPASLAGRRANTKYVNERHKRAAYRARLKARATAAGIPVNLSLKALDALSGTRKRDGDAPRAAPARKSGISVRVAYRKAVEVVAGELARHLGSELLARRRAEDLLLPLLSERGRRAVKTGGA